MSTVLDRNVTDRVVVLHVPIESDVELAEDLTVPAGIVGIDTFRQWIHSSGFPKRYRIDYIEGRIWIDLSMETAYSHNQVKSAFIVGIEKLREQNNIGRFFGDKMRIRLAHVEVSTEPDSMFVTDNLRAGKVRSLTAKRGDPTEFEGAPNMILEILSDFSEEMDQVERPALYFRAGVGEYWRVDARSNLCELEILVAGEEAFEPTTGRDGWLHSPLFGKWLRLHRDADPLGNAQFRLLSKD